MTWTGLDYYDKDGNLHTAGDADWTPADWYNGGANAASPYTANDGNTFYVDIDDKTARQWNIESVTNQLADVDNDGLSNMDEYLAARDTLVPGAADLDVRNNFSNGTTLDYFRTNGVSGAGRRYLGEIATDHDFIEDWYEDFYNTDSASRNRYDAYNDREEDGWSNWSEARAGTNPELFGTLSLVRYDLTEDNVVAEYPIPTIGVTLTYQTMDTFDSSIVLKAWHGDTAAGTPDAVVNTVPAVIFGPEALSGFGDARLLELASAPYGFDMDAARALGKTVELCSGLPGKCAPRAAAAAIRDVIYSVLEDGKP